MLSRGTLLNPARLDDSVATNAPYLLVDNGLDSGHLGKEAVRLRRLRRSDLVSLTAPTDGTDSEGAQSVVHLGEEGIADLAQHLAADRMSSFTACQARIC